jgi:hypothetical protein
MLAKMEGAMKKKMKMNALYGTSSGFMLEDEGLSINDLAPQRGIRCHSCEL